MSKVELIKIKDIDDGMRLNRWFLKYYPAVPMSRLQKLLRTKQIKVDGKKVETGTKLSTGQEIRIPPMETDNAIVEKTGRLSAKDTDFIQSLVIFKDDNIIVLNKPSGLAVQGGTNTNRHVDGMLDGLKFGSDERPKLVHRIDKETSGILLLARNRKYAEKLTKAFREHSLKKTYLALVIGKPQKDEGEIKAPLEKVGEKSFAVDDGRKAVTDYKVIDSVGKKFSLVEALPVTGRTHQIRAHMEYIETPIVGDGKYYGETRQKFDIFADKLHLHAYKIDLSGIYNKKTIIVAKLPEYFIDSINAVGMNFKG
ncbi:MAG: RluA family pseudouridine synthase [Lactobacillaceae bacterium]|jgi:23S rRNA pseudouridine955/2504/2580 synthase|nr:RluA family pseudouridine synthase [Lactobacillaceae bacterium]